MGAGPLYPPIVVLRDAFNESAIAMCVRTVTSVALSILRRG
jgi:hypothetical protein